MKRDLSTLLFAIFASVLAVVFTLIFYQSSLRDRIENKLYDIRTRLAPTLTQPNQVHMVTIDGDTIESIEAPGAKDVSIASLESGLQILARSRAKAIIVLLPPQVTPYNTPALPLLVRQAKRDQRIKLGVFGLESNAEVVLPAAFSGAETSVFAADVAREFRRQVLRDFVVSERGKQPTKLLRHLLDENMFEAQVRDLPFNEDGTFFRLRYYRQESLPQTKLEDLIADPNQIRQFDDKYVVVGYSAFRPWSMGIRESTFVNSPWNADGDDVAEGIPLIALYAIAIENLASGTWLRQAPVALNIVQTAMLMAGAAGIWLLSVGFASLLFIGGVAIVLLVHAIVLWNIQSYLPLSDTVYFASLATTAFAMWKLSIEGRARAAQRARAQADRALAQVQERFLNRFAAEMIKINEQVLEFLRQGKSLGSGTGTLKLAYGKALASCQELLEYLDGIQQFAKIEGHSAARPTAAQVDIRAVVDAVVAQFDGRLLEKNQHVDVQVTAGLQVVSDATLLSQIVFNFVSNAIKYSPENSQIKIVGQQDKKTVRLSVIDQGEGIPEHEQKKIFEKFYRIKNDLVYQVKGHGLGLYLTYYFAEQIGAKISVDSQIHQGSTFTIELAEHHG